eukprot:6123832-Alexandrium_andersonii.AAC.1
MSWVVPRLPRSGREGTFEAVPERAAKSPQSPGVGYVCLREVPAGAAALAQSHLELLPKGRGGVAVSAVSPSKAEPAASFKSSSTEPD